MAIGSALSVGLIGLKAFIVQIQAFVSPGLPYFSIIGLPDTSLSEARERVKSACQASGFKWPETRVTVNLSPASMPKKGSSHDLAIAASVLSAAGAIAHDCLAGTIVLGEVNLDGTVLPINGLLPIMLHAREQGIATIIVPYANLDEARLVPDVKAIGVRHVGELIELMGGDADYRIPEATHARERRCRRHGHVPSARRHERSDGPASGQMGVGGGCRRRPSSDDDRSARHRQDHARFAHSRHHESFERDGTA